MDAKLEQKALLPCPFCGGGARIASDHGRDGSESWVTCNDCGARSRSAYWLQPIEKESKRKVVEAWNTRALQAQPAEGGVPDGFVLVPGVYVNKEGRPVMSTEGDNMTPAILLRRSLRPLYAAAPKPATTTGEGVGNG